MDRTISKVDSPDCRIDAICVFPEASKGARSVGIPETDGVIPAAAEEHIAPYQVPVQRIHLAAATIIVDISIEYQD